jgi:3-hydroxyisobutyrate dehydrogenase-like beta-hydroxyacid dehydrogenase
MATTTATKLGFVGLGRMGGNMAARFLAGGYAVYGEEQSRADGDELVGAGLRWCDTPREVAESADVVFTSLPDADVLELVASGDEVLTVGRALGYERRDLAALFEVLDRIASRPA